jgi:cytochrome c oxidase assembly protein subunit 15
MKLEGLGFHHIIMKDNLGLHRYALLLAVCTLFLVVAGASVTSNDAGLSVPDWPLSYGKVMPPMTGGIFYEHGHRMVASTVGFLTIILAFWLWRADNRPWMRKLGFAALGMVILQGVLGGLTVIFLLPKAISIFHACLAELFFSLTVAIAIFTSPSWKRGPVYVEDCGSPSMRTLGTIVPVTVLGQVAMGAAFRHHLVNIIPHIIGALLVGGLILFASIAVLTEFKTHAALRKTGIALISITFCQVFLGIAAYLSRISNSDSIQPMPVMVAFTVAHVAVGAMTMAASVALAIQIRRNVQPSTAGAYQAA